MHQTASKLNLKSAISRGWRGVPDKERSAENNGLEENDHREASMVPKSNLSDYGVFLLYAAREFIGCYRDQDFSMIYGRKFGEEEVRAGVSCFYKDADANGASRR
jgi:hypothetical protein